MPLLALVELRTAMAQTAEDRETARSLMDLGDEQADQGDIERALVSYKAAHELMRVPTTGIEVARAYAKLGKLVEARDVALEVLRMPIGSKDPRPFAQARDDADQLARSLQPKIPTLRFELSPKPESAILKVDGEPVPLVALQLSYALNPGEHTIEVQAAGFQAVTRRFALDPGESKSIQWILEPIPQPDAHVSGPTATAPSPPPAHSEPRPSPGPAHLPLWIGVGTAGAGLIVGAVAGVISLERTNDARGNCIGNRCTAQAQHDIDVATSAANVSNVGFGVAGLGAAIGLIGWLVYDGSRSPKPRVSARCSISPDGVGVQVGGTLW